MIANRVIVPVDSAGQAALSANTPTNLAVDVSGYYTGTGARTGSEFTPEIVPVRICDTRGSNPSSLAPPELAIKPRLSGHAAFLTAG